MVSLHLCRLDLHPMYYIVQCWCVCVLGFPLPLPPGKVLPICVTQ
jgi:hypothetical protein